MHECNSPPFDLCTLMKTSVFVTDMMVELTQFCRVWLSRNFRLATFMSFIIVPPVLLFESTYAAKIIVSCILVECLNISICLGFFVVVFFIRYGNRIVRIYGVN